MIARCEMLDANGEYAWEVSVPEDADPKALAYEILSAAPDNEGSSVRLWLDAGHGGDLGDPDAWLLGTGTPWMRRLPLAFSAADAGGDQQVSDAFEATWIAPLADGTWAHVERTYYVVEDDRTKHRWMERQDEYLNCHRPSEPGGTEINAEYVHAAVGDAHEDPERLATESFAPEPGEWEKHRYPGCCGTVDDGS